MQLKGSQSPKDLAAAGFNYSWGRNRDGEYRQAKKYLTPLNKVNKKKYKDLYTINEMQLALQNKQKNLKRKTPRKKRIRPKTSSKIPSSKKKIYQDGLAKKWGLKKVSGAGLLDQYSLLLVPLLLLFLLSQ